MRVKVSTPMVRILTIAFIILNTLPSNLGVRLFARVSSRPQGHTPDDSKRGKEIEIRDILIAEDKTSYRGFVVRRLHKRVKMFGGSDYLVSDASYVKLMRAGKTVLKFDGIYHPMGNGADFALFPLLGGKAKQLLVSLDTFRTGTQWIVSLNRHAHVLYDGRFWGTGRETDDFRIVDLDGDGVYEITAWITDFYDLQDKMSMSQIPLPEIIFQYSRAKRRYLPANNRYPVTFDAETDVESLPTKDEFGHRSIILRRVLDLVFAGRKKQAWDYFAVKYKLDDRLEIKRRVNAILSRQPVYRFIYNHPRRRR